MTSQKPRQDWFKIILGVLVTIYGIAATLVTYQSSQLNSKSREMTFVGIMELTRGNDAYAVADKQADNDFDALTQMILIDSSGGNQAEWQIWHDTLSEDALVSLDRSDNLDDQYYTEVYAWPDDLYDNADLAYATAQDYDEISNRYDLVVLMLAMGLAFVGWASLTDDIRLLRSFFAVLSFLMLGISFLVWALAFMNPLSPVVVPLV